MDLSNVRAIRPVSELEAIEKALFKIKARKEGTLKFLKTAWPKFDDAFCDGIEWRTITVVGARPGTGKTLFMEQLVSDIIERNTDQNFRVLKFQMEMVDETSGVRKLSQRVGADYNTLMSKEDSLDETTYQKCLNVFQNLKKSDLVNVVYDACTVREMCATIIYELEKHKYITGQDSMGTPIYQYINTLVAIDHSALFLTDRHEKDKFEMLNNLGAALTYMKKHYPVSFVVLSQLNRNVDNEERTREGTYGNYLMDSDIYGSDALLQHCDVLVAINKPSIKKIKYYGPERFNIDDPEMLAFHFLKSRNGTTRLSFFRFNRETVRIEEAVTPTSGIKLK